MLYSFFWHQKAIKNRQALHEVIRASSLSIIFVDFFFETCISHHGCENFQIYGNLQFLEDVLGSQNINSRYFYSYAATSPPIPPITPEERLSELSSRFYHPPQVTMTWNIRLFIFYIFYDL